jgi:hypothetical protein
VTSKNIAKTPNKQLRISLMKKLIKFAGVAIITSASLFAQAESNTVYGDFRYSYNNLDDGTGSTTRLDNNASRIGFKGDFGESEGIIAFYHLQAGVNVDGGGDALTQRFFFAGIKGSFGKLTLGRTSTPYKMAGLRVDPFYDTAAGSGLGGSNYGLSGLTNGWTDNSIAYASPKVGAFSFNAGTYLDDSDADEHDTNFGFTYKQDAFTGGIQFLSVAETGVVAKSAPDSTALRMHAAYSMGAWNIGASLETIDPDGAEEQQYTYISATYKMSDKIKVSGSLGSVSDVSTALDGSGVTLGLFYQLLAKTNVYTLYSSIDPDDSSAADRSVFSIGISHKFSFN